MFDVLYWPNYNISFLYTTAFSLVSILFTLQRIFTYFLLCKFKATISLGSPTIQNQYRAIPNTENVRQKINRAAMTLLKTAIPDLWDMHNVVASQHCVLASAKTSNQSAKHRLHSNYGKIKSDLRGRHRLRTCEQKQKNAYKQTTLSQ